MNKIKFTVAAVLISIFSVFASFAEMTDVIADSFAMDEEVALKLIENTGFTYCDGFIISDNENLKENLMAVDDNINQYYRDCDLCDILYIGDWFEASADGNVYINIEGFSKLEEYQNFIDEKAAEIVRSIIPGGTADDAIHAVFNYMCDNYSYDTALYEAALNGDLETYAQLINDSQGAYYTLINNCGVCSSFSKTFRALIESIPVTDGMVNWKTESPGYIPVAIIDNSTMTANHEWCAIEKEGGWRFFDLANQIGNATSSDLHTNDGSTPYANMQVWRWFY